MAELTDSDIQAKVEEEAWLQEVQEPIKKDFSAQQQAALHRGEGVQIGGAIAGQMHWSVTNQIRHAAFSSAMDIHRNRGTGHDEIIESARAFEAYLTGE